MSIEAAYPLARVACLNVAKAHKQGTIKRCKPFGTTKKRTQRKNKETEKKRKKKEKEIKGIAKKTSELEQTL